MNKNIAEAKFINESKRTDPTNERWQTPGDYSFDRPSKYLFQCSGYLQRLISQAGTFLLGGAYHAKESGIYKSEGGCKIHGIGDLVLGKRQLYFEYSCVKDCNAKLMADLVSEIVLAFNPNDPIMSMNFAAVKFINEQSNVKTSVKDIEAAIKNSSNGGVFGGNALADFFDWNPFSKPPRDENYEFWYRVNILHESQNDVEQAISDRKLGYELLDKMIEKNRQFKKKNNDNSYGPQPMCCSPQRDGKKLQFWINTGRSTNIDGWKTLEQINEFLKGNGKIVDQRR
jgi:hypothetical protein